MYMFICMCMCMCIYVYTYVYKCVSILTCIYTQLCVEAYNWESALLHEACQTVVGSNHFPGLYESLLYYEDRADEFIGPDALHLLWSRICAMQLSLDPFALLSFGARGGGALSDYVLQGRRASAGAAGVVNTTAVLSLLVCLGAECKDTEHGGVFNVSRGGSHTRLGTISRATPLDAVWSEHGGSSTVLRALAIDSSVPSLDNIIRELTHTLQTEEPAVILSLSSAHSRTHLAAAVAVLHTQGYHTFLAGTERLIILVGDMWHPSFALPLPAFGGVGGVRDMKEDMTYVAIKASSALYLPLLALYNTSGMVISCRPYRMSSFHTPDGPPSPPPLRTHPPSPLFSPRSPSSLCSSLPSCPLAYFKSISSSPRVVNAFLCLKCVLRSCSCSLLRALHLPAPPPLSRARTRALSRSLFSPLFALSHARAYLSPPLFSPNIPHDLSGYWADDCPPNFNVYRSSRLKLFEVGLEQGRQLHAHSLLHHRRNVFSEAGEDG